MIDAHIILTNHIQDSPGFSSSHTTPSHAPTPINTSFLKGEASNNATPTSATSANKTGAGLKKTAVSAASTKKNGEDSETDMKDAKKLRTNFGASRK
jgi:chromatin modification-related protein EAF6